MMIRNAVPEDLDRILILYEQARKFMREQGNMKQWLHGYPQESTLLEDMARSCLYVAETDEGGELLAVYYAAIEEEETYRVIYGGEWLNDAPYAVVHRIAVADRRKGLAAEILQRILEQAGNLRIDTHEENIPMRRLLEKEGFTCCGVIRLANGDPRLAYQKVLRSCGSGGSVMDGQNGMDLRGKSKTKRPAEGRRKKAEEYVSAFLFLMAIALAAVVLFLWLGRMRGYGLEGGNERFETETTAAENLSSFSLATMGLTPVETAEPVRLAPLPSEAATSAP